MRRRVGVQLCVYVFIHIYIKYFDDPFIVYANLCTLETVFYTLSSLWRPSDYNTNFLTQLSALQLTVQPSGSTGVKTGMDVKEKGFFFFFFSIFFFHFEILEVSVSIIL